MRHSLREIKRKILTHSRKRIVEAARFVESGLKNDDFLDLQKRIIGIHEKEKNSFNLLLNSDGLNLNNKLFIEKICFKEIPKDLQKLDFEIKFQKQHKKHSLEHFKAPIASAIKEQKKARKIPGIKNIIAIASGKGGVGKSHVSVNLALALAHKGLKVGILDADVYGPSLPMMLNIKSSQEINDQKKLIPIKAYELSCMSMGLIVGRYDPLIWRGPLIAKTIEEFCFQSEWGEQDYLIIDLPPGTGDIQLTFIEEVSLDAAIIITGPQDMALSDAHRGLSMFTRNNVRVLGIVENMVDTYCPHCNHKVNIFGSGGGKKMAQERSLPLLAEIPLKKNIDWQLT